MFTPKVIVLISCLMALATADSDPPEIRGVARTKAIAQLKLSLDKLAAKPNAPKYTFNPDEVSKVTPSSFGDKQVVYTLKLKKDNDVPKVRTVYLTVTDTFDDIIVKTEGEREFSATVSYPHNPSK